MGLGRGGDWDGTVSLTLGVEGPVPEAGGIGPDRWTSRFGSGLGSVPALNQPGKSRVNE